MSAQLVKDQNSNHGDQLRPDLRPRLVHISFCPYCNKCAIAILKQSNVLSAHDCLVFCSFYLSKDMTKSPE